ncbi:MAG: hypothetical protein V7K98_23720 [Nostoc sp.]|uniref:hypothetical protein n=1 Tax=Nostoc sp. TaxID=1180 RepID=UPI002FFA1D34
MQNQNADPHLTNLILNADFDHLNQALTLRLFGEVREHRRRIDALEEKLDLLNEYILQILDSQNEQIEESKGLILNCIRHKDSEIENLQGLVNIYCPLD